MLQFLFQSHERGAGKGFEAILMAVNAMNTTKSILVNRDVITIVKINNPEKKNAISQSMWIEIKEIFEDIGNDDSIRSIILTGGKDFCSGADISEFSRLRTTSSSAYDGYVDAAIASVFGIRKPVIAAISGYCLGGGMSLALACDFRVADRTATFGIPAARLGIVYGWFECRQLAAIVGVSEAKRILFTGARFAAERAATIGFADVAEGDVLDTARKIAGVCAANAPLSISGMKLALNAVALGEEAERNGEFEDAERIARASDDYKEAVAAFAAKRTPRFTGR